MYVAVKGGEQAIDAAHRLLAEERRGDRSVPGLTLDQIAEQLTLAVDRVMNEGSLYDRELAALAVKQARGDLIEAIFLIRATRTTLARFGYAEPLETPLDAREAPCVRRIQGHSRRADPWANLRLYASPAGLLACGRCRSLNLLAPRPRKSASRCRACLNFWAPKA